MGGLPPWLISPHVSAPISSPSQASNGVYGIKSCVRVITFIWPTHQYLQGQSKKHWTRTYTLCLTTAVLCDPAQTVHSLVHTSPKAQPLNETTTDMTMERLLSISDRTRTTHQTNSRKETLMTHSLTFNNHPCVDLTTENATPDTLPYFTSTQPPSYYHTETSVQQQIQRARSDILLKSLTQLTFPKPLSTNKTNCASDPQ